jgi:esterase/lipase
MRVLFLHGLESSPQGPKVLHLQQNPSFEVQAPALDTQPVMAFLKRGGPEAELPPLLESSVRIASEALARFAPHAVVGSSFGGAIALMLAHREVWAGPLVLLAPASRAKVHLPARHGRVVIVHGRQDETVPVDDSVQLAARSPTEVVLWLVDDDHRLSKSLKRGCIDRAIEQAVAPS